MAHVLYLDGMLQYLPYLLSNPRLTQSPIIPFRAITKTDSSWDCRLYKALITGLDVITLQKVAF